MLRYCGNILNGLFYMRLVFEVCGLWLLFNAKKKGMKLNFVWYSLSLFINKKNVLCVSVQNDAQSSVYAVGKKAQRIF